MVVAFFQDLWNSIFEPGATPVLIKATHLSFTGLVITLLVLLYVTGSFYFIAMLALSIGLWLSVAWFISEYTKIMENEKIQKDSKASDPITSSTSTVKAESGILSQRPQ